MFNIKIVDNVLHVYRLNKNSTPNEFKTALNVENIIRRYPQHHISNWNISEITDMTMMFRGVKSPVHATI